MKIQPAQADSFCQKPDNSVNGVLVYGPDNGLTSIRMRKLSRAIVADPKDPFLITHLVFKDIKKDPALLTDNLNAMCLTGGRRLIIIDGVDGTITPTLKSIIKDYTGQHMLLLTAGDLAASSALRKLFETQKHLAAIACYKDDVATIRRVIMDTLKTNNMNATSEAIDLLSHRFSGDRLVVLSELEKLMLYKNFNGTINAEDVDTCITDNVEMSLDALCHACANADAKHIDHALSRALSENIAPITIIRTLSYYFMRLHIARSHMDAGASSDQAISQLKPPVFFKHKALFKQHISKLSRPSISMMLKKLADLEDQCKFGQINPELLLQHFLNLAPRAIYARS